MTIGTEFDIGEIVKARDRLWRIDQIIIKEKMINDELKKFALYSVSNITGQPSSQLLIPDIEPIEKSTVPKPSADKIGSPGYQRLLLDAIKLDLIYGTTSFISLQNSKVIPVSYQMVPVLMALNLKNTRLLLADDVGLGKTIESGLILQELLGRKRINRVLFVTPANLREQWKTILKHFFGIDAVIMSRRNRRHLESELLVGGNPWGYYNFVITSIDYGKRPGIREEILQFEWDMIIIDEVHNVMRPHLGSDDETSKSFKQSYGFAKALANQDKYPHLLLLSATPHNGYKDSFASLLEMINPDIVEYGKTRMEIKIDRDLAINHICQRRRKDVEDWLSDRKDKKRIFPERDSDEVYITPSQKFYDCFKLINEFSEHVLSRGKDDPEERKKFGYWTILHFHKRAISSPNSLRCSVENRLDELENKINKNFRAINETDSFISTEEAAQSVMDGNETDRLTEEELDKRNDILALSKKAVDLVKEKQLLIKVKNSAKELMEDDSKLNHLIEYILPERFKISKKIIIFTRYIDTLTYIKENLEIKVKDRVKYKNIDLFTVHGQMASQKRQEVYDDFLRSKQGILITTDCMAEGIDLQFSADQIINYELTWNPNRLEQRNGRIDRFGQPKEVVYIRTLILKDTLEMDILEAIVHKANEIKKAYGFVPGFFGDPESVIDHLTEKRRKEKRQDAQKSLDRWIKFSHNIIEDIVSVFFSKKNVEEMVKDSFYGHNNINLEEIEERMLLTEQEIGNTETLLDFIERATDLYHGTIEVVKDEEDILEITLPEEVQKYIGFEFEDKYLITPNREISASRNDIEAINLKNPLISGLVEKVKNEAFSVENEFYGRTAAFLSEEASKVSAVFHVKIRYLVNTEPKGLMEEVAKLGIDLFSGEVLSAKLIESIWKSDSKNHEKKDIELKKHLKKALETPNLDELLKSLAEEQLEIIIAERKEMIANLKNQGITTDLQGIENIEIVGIDLLTITLIYPPIGGG